MYLQNVSYLSAYLDVINFDKSGLGEVAIKIIKQVESPTSQADSFDIG